MFQKLPLIIRKYDKGLQVDKRSQTDTNVTMFRRIKMTIRQFGNAVMQKRGIASHDMLLAISGW